MFRMCLFLGVFCLIPAAGYGEDVAGKIRSLCASLSSGDVPTCITEQNRALVKLQSYLNKISPEASAGAEEGGMLDSLSIVNCIAEWTKKNGLIDYKAAVKCLEKPPAYTL